MAAEIKVYIGLNEEIDFGIDDDDNLVVIRDPGNNDPTIISLGKATTKNFADIISYVHRLSTFAI